MLYDFTKVSLCYLFADHISCVHIYCVYYFFSFSCCKDERKMVNLGATFIMMEPVELEVDNVMNVEGITD